MLLAGLAHQSGGLSMKPAAVLALTAALVSIGSGAYAGVTILVADRTAHKIWRLTDANSNGIIEPNEVFVWFDGTNAAGTPNISNIGAFALRSTDNLVVAGDIALHQYYAFQDLNNDGDAQDPGESRVIITASNASGAATQVPSGVAFMANGDLLIDNSGSGTTTVFPDAIYRCHDIDGDGLYQSAGEITPWVTDGPSGFGSGNGPFVPQDLLIDASGVGFLHNAGGVNPGVYKFQDGNGNGRADDAGEFTPWFTAANLSGVTVSAGFPLEPDTARFGSLYYLQTATGSVDQVYRLTDLDHNGDANGVGEAVLVYSTAEANFTSNDLLIMPGGADLLVSDVTTKRIIRLTDLDGDGLFTSPGERSDFFLAGAGPVLDTRQMVRMRDIYACGSADFNCDGDYGTDADIEAFFECLGGNCPHFPCTNTADFNGDGDVGTDADIETFFRVLAGATC
jgi:hypothetical protein